jgi:hypothetical protein
MRVERSRGKEARPHNRTQHQPRTHIKPHQGNKLHENVRRSSTDPPCAPTAAAPAARRTPRTGRSAAGPATTPPTQSTLQVSRNTQREPDLSPFYAKRAQQLTHTHTPIASSAGSRAASARFEHCNTHARTRKDQPRSHMKEDPRLNVEAEHADRSDAGKLRVLTVSNNAQRTQ